MLRLGASRTKYKVAGTLLPCSDLMPIFTGSQLRFSELQHYVVISVQQILSDRIHFTAYRFCAAAETKMEPFEDMSDMSLLGVKISMLAIFDDPLTVQTLTEFFLKSHTGEFLHLHIPLARSES